MAPSTKILKRQRSRPSDWWAANPAVESLKPAPAPMNPAKTTPNKIIKRKSTRRASLPAAASSVPRPPEVEERGDNASREGPGSLKRKRSRPSEWWAANPSSAGEEKSLELVVEKKRAIKKKRVSLPIDSTAEGAEREDIAMKKTTNKKRARFSLPVSSSLPEPESEREVNSSALKRQRSRPSEWWAANPVASEPKSTEPAQVVPAKGAMPKKKTRFSLPATPIPRNAEEEGEPNSSGSKRERRKPSGRWAASSSATVGTPARISKSHEHSESNTSSGSEDILGLATVASKYTLRGEPLKQDQSPGEEEIVEVQTASSAFGRGRPAKAAGRVVRPINTSKEKDGPSVAKKGSKTSKSQSQSSQTESSSSSVGKKGRRPSNSQSSHAPARKASKSSKQIPEKESQIEQPKTKRKRKSEEKAEQEVQRVKRPRASEIVEEEEQGEENESEDELVPYQRLVPVIRKVHRHTIDAKWQPLPPGCVDLISQLLVDTQRPVVARQTQEIKRGQASTALQWISRKLVRKIGRGLPFPIGTHRQPEDEFNFEKIIDRNRVTEGQLTAEIDANKLLDENLTKELDLLEVEKAALLELETNAKTESSRRKQAERKSHPLLQWGDSPASDDLESMAVITSRVLPSLGVSLDENLQTVVLEVEGHVDSMQSNIKQLSGIPDAISKAKAAVQATLLDHLEDARYKDVLLGPG